jgi:tRNA threonylcarbamoyladenosine biosynthesis protein TsaB
MRLLALDSSAASCSVALWDDRQEEATSPVVAHGCKPMERGQSETLIPMVKSVMDEAGWIFEDIDRLGVTVGPGSFTGVRIGLAAARGLALARGLPLVGVTSLEVIALEARAEGEGEDNDGDTLPPDSLLVTLSAGRRDLYFQMFSRNKNQDQVFPWKPAGPPGSAMPEEVPGHLPEKGLVLIAGNGAALIRHVLATEERARSGCRIVYGDGPGLPDAAAVAVIAAGRDPEAFESGSAPLYIHPHYARLPQSKAKEGAV